MFAFLAAEPAFAQTAMVEVFATGARMMERRDRTIDGLQGYLARGYELSPDTPAIAGEAIGGATYALVYEQIRRHGTETLPRVAPTATYLALAPFLGAEEACAVAGGRGRSAPPPLSAGALRSERRGARSGGRRRGRGRAGG
jgi:hypothetical protein